MKEIDNIVKKVLLESLNEKADEITNEIHSKLSGEMGEAECKEGDCGEMKEIGFKQGLAKAARKKFRGIPKSLEDKFHLSDFADEGQTDVEPGYSEFDYVAEDECTEGDCGEMEESMDRGQGDIEKYREAVIRAFSKLYPDDEHINKELKKQDKDGEIGEELHGNQKKIDVAPPKGKITKADFDKLRSKKKQTDEEMEEGNAFTKALENAREEGEEEFKVRGKKYPVHKESFSYSIHFDNEELVLTENELITMIEEIVLEEKKGNLKSTGKSKGMVEFDRVHKKDADINKKANQESFKKMKDYVKDGSKGSFDPNPKQFPKGNGELAKMDKKAYKASDAVGEYIDNFAYGGGMADLYTDEIGYNEDWLEKNIEGSAMTGNSPEYANAVDTGYGKKINKRRKEGLYNKEKRQGSYNRVKQPVDVAGENTKSGKLNKMFKNLGESEEKKEILSEEMQRMKEMIGYNKKSQ
jgi:hypothetical protein